MKENNSKKFYNQIITAETRKLLDKQCQKSMRSRPKQIEYLVKRESKIMLPDYHLVKAKAN